MKGLNDTCKESQAKEDKENMHSTKNLKNPIYKNSFNTRRFRRTQPKITMFTNQTKINKSESPLEILLNLIK